MKWISLAQSLIHVSLSGNYGSKYSMLLLDQNNKVACVWIIYIDNYSFCIDYMNHKVKIFTCNFITSTALFAISNTYIVHLGWSQTIPTSHQKWQWSPHITGAPTNTCTETQHVSSSCLSDGAYIKPPTGTQRLSNAKCDADFKSKLESVKFGNVQGRLCARILFSQPKLSAYSLDASRGRSGWRILYKEWHLVLWCVCLGSISRGRFALYKHDRWGSPQKT